MNRNLLAITVKAAVETCEVKFGATAVRAVQVVQHEHILHVVGEGSTFGKKKSCPGET